MSRALLTCIVVSFACVSAPAQEIDVDKFYGIGVHEYFNGDYKSALQTFNTTIDAGSTDPRVYYYRGLTNTMLNHSEAAAADFRLGAELEAQGRGNSSVINDSLERIQGPIRLALEKSRRSGQQKLVAELKVKRTRINVSGKTPFDSPQISDANSQSNDQSNPNLKDSSKVNDPTAPFPNLKSGATPRTPAAKPKIKSDAFGVKKTAENPEPSAVGPKPESAPLPKPAKVNPNPDDPFAPKAKDKPADSKDKPADPFATKKAESDPKKSDEKLPSPVDAKKDDKGPAKDPFGNDGKKADDKKAPEKKDDSKKDPFGG
jgi:hypothetical protein